MKKVSSLVALLLSTTCLFFASAAMAGGIPVAAIIQDDSGLSVVCINFDSNYTMGEVNQLYNIIAPVLDDLSLSGENITTFPPSTLMQQFKDADYLDSVIRGALSQLSNYLQIKATKVNGPAGENLRFDAWMWNSMSASNGMYIGAIEIPESLLELLTTSEDLSF